MRLVTTLWLVWTALAAANPRPNVLLLCVDDLRPELSCYGASHIQSPHIDALAAAGRQFMSHYVQAPTCGASRYALLTGCYGPADNDALFKRAKKPGADTSPTLPAWFRRHGYTTVSVGKVSHHPGGRGGPDWNDQQILEMPDSWDRHLMPSGEWQHPRGAMHGLAHGQIRSAVMDVFQSAKGGDDIYPDGHITRCALEQLDQLAPAAATGGQPFFLAIGWLKPHLPFGAPAKYYEPYAGITLPPIPHPQKPQGLTTWHPSGEFRRYHSWGKDPRQDFAFADEVRKHYAACVTYADTQVGVIIDKLQQLGLADNTIVVLWGDHGWHLGEHAIWGKHSLFEESLRAPLIIASPRIPQPGAASKAIVETIDIYPTLCGMAGLQPPATLDGRSLAPQLADPGARGGTAVSYTPAATTLRTPDYRLIVHRGKNAGAIELYDHRGDDGECTNIADQHPELVGTLRQQLDAVRPAAATPQP